MRHDRNRGQALVRRQQGPTPPWPRGCRTNQTGCTNLTTADFADVVRAAQAARAGPPQRKWFTPESSPCGRRTKSRDTRWFVRQPPRDAGRSFNGARFVSRRETGCPHRRPGAALLHPPGGGGVRRRGAVARAVRPDHQRARGPRALAESLAIRTSRRPLRETGLWGAKRELSAIPFP